MPHKRNPVARSKSGAGAWWVICCARKISAVARADIHTVVERVIFPDSTILVDLHAGEMTGIVRICVSFEALERNWK